MNYEKPISKRYAVAALPSGTGFVGAYDIPGKDQQLARCDDGSIAVLDTEDEAVAAAGEDLCKAMNERSKFSYRHNYRRMGGAELAVKLAELDIGPASLAIMYGTQQDRVIKWLDGAEDVPWPVSLLLHLFEDGAALERAQQFVDRNKSKKS
jgi:hypothetical protein